MAPSQDKPKRHLLNLPPELRNRIWRECVVEESPIAVYTNGYTRSALLATAKQIRTETLKIFFYENTFWLISTDWSCSPDLEFHRVIQGLNLQLDSRPCMEKLHGEEKYDCVTSCRLQFKASASADSWPELMHHLWHIHQGNLPGNEYTPQGAWEADDRDALDHVVGCMYSIAETMRARPWGEVKEVLELHRTTLGCLDGGWMEEKEGGE